LSPGEAAYAQKVERDNGNQADLDHPRHLPMLRSDSPPKQARALWLLALSRIRIHARQ
jgi:hypothetical protein